MSSLQTNEALCYLAQGMSIKDVAYTLGVWEWDVARLMRNRRK